MRRVSTIAGSRQLTLSGGAEWDLVPSIDGSELALTSLMLEPDAETEVGDDLRDTLLFVVTGSGRSETAELAEGAAVMIAAGERAHVTASGEGLSAVRGTIGPAVDLHAPMGRLKTVERLTSTEAKAATGSRSFQILFDPNNGSTRATLFVGHIPPGRAPWHYHLYDEIVWVLAGDGRLHLGEGVEALAAGSAFRLRPREVHIVENTSEDAPLSVLGLFTPAGSPSAAYLEPGVFEQYVIA